ncbi:tyrosine-type recombinase/integrase [Corynebacterium pyruviciproducens]|uniref:Site-specific integrase n=1 Tax=Corynebacterium pyruviciproducens TaxID=598660 RepID=A0AAF1BWZ4_9CORY|nr:site-specific integrase [Corynebacterium pyruviciproducens]WOT02887.1 site-specific integrase [Corynebacterium pyruviciproducens]
MGELYGIWEPIQRATVKPKTAYDRASNWRLHVRDVWEGRNAAQITKTEVQAWLAAMVDRGAGYSTVSHALDVLRRVLEVGLDSGALLSNPARGVKLPPKPRGGRVYLNVAQVETLAGAVEDLAGENSALLVRVLAYTGLRWGEATALRAGDVDLEARRLNVNRAVSTVGGKLVYGTPKTGRGRSVPFPDGLSEALGVALEGLTKDGLVFRSATGKALRASNWRNRVWAAALEDTSGTVPSGVHIHDLRHTAASLAISAGANVKAVQAMLGHSSAAMTLDTYADLFPDDLDAVGEAMNDLISEGRRGTFRAV